MLRNWKFHNEQVILTTPFDYKGVKTCDAIALVPTSFRRLQETSRFLRSERGLGLKAFDFLAADCLAKRYLRGKESTVKTLELAFNDHNVKLVIDLHNAELVLPSRFKDRKAEEEFHKKRMLDFAEKIGINHPSVRVLPIYVRIVEDGDMLHYVSFEEYLQGGKEKIIWRAKFVLKDVESCKFMVQMCLDFRFRLETFDLVRSSFKFPYYHLVGIAGSCRDVLDGDETALESIERAVRSGAEIGLSVAHRGCAAYKKIIGEMNSREEKRFQRDQLLKNAVILKKMGLKEVWSVYADLIHEEEMIEYAIVR